MSTLALFRYARKAFGLPAGVEYPNLEALMEAEAGQPHNDYRICSIVFPAIFSVLGCVSFIGVAVSHKPIFFLGPVLAFGIAAALWFLFDYLDKRIPPSSKKIRALCEQIASRYRGFSNVVGVEPTLHPVVGQMLDEASAIYLKHRASCMQGGSNPRAAQALEEAMGQMLELGKAPNVRAQEVELAAGWAGPLLAEMRDLDQALDHHAQTSIGRAEYPLMKLREARLEIQGIETAMAELEQTQGS